MKFNKKLFNKLYSIFFVLFILYIIIGAYMRSTYLNSKNAKVKYTIAKIYKFEKGRNQFFYYEYYIDNKKHSSSYDITANSSEYHSNQFYLFDIGHYFLVKYSVKKPRFSELLYNKPVPDSLKNCTNCVWDKPPF